MQDTAPVPELRVVASEQTPGIRLRVLELPIDGTKASREYYFASREFADAFRRTHIRPDWPASFGFYWSGHGDVPQKVAGAASSARSVYFVARGATKPGSELELTGTPAKPLVRICEITFDPAAFPRQLTLAVPYLLHRIAVQDQCSLRGLTDRALLAEMRAPLDRQGYGIVESKAFPSGVKVSLVEYSGKASLNWAAAAGAALGAAKLGAIMPLPGGSRTVTLIRQTNGTNAFVFHDSQDLAPSSRNVCVFQGHAWPGGAVPDYNRTWPLPAEQDPAMVFCQAARKRSDDRYLRMLNEAARKTPITSVPLPN